MTTIDLTPTLAGYRRMQTMMRHSIKSHEITIKEIAILSDRVDSYMIHNDTGYYSEMETSTLYEGLEALMELRRKDVEELTKSVNEIEVYCSIIEGGY